MSVLELGGKVRETLFLVVDIHFQVVELARTLILLSCCTRTAATSGRLTQMALKRMSSSSSRVGLLLASVRAAKLCPGAGGELAVVAVNVGRACQRGVTHCLQPVALS